MPGLEPILNPGMRVAGSADRAEVIDQYASRTGYDVDGVRWYEAFAAWKTAVVLQQLYARWVRGESNGPADGGARPEGRGTAAPGPDYPRLRGAVNSISRVAETGQWALMNGASKGIGYGIAERLVDDGANVVLVARNRDDLDEARRTLEDVAGDGQQVVVRSTDTADRVAIADLFAWVRDELPGLNVLVANAGSGAVIPFLDLSIETWDATLALNLTGTFLCMQEAARTMIRMPKDANRTMVVVSSIRGLGVRPGLAAYASTKAAVNQLVRMVAYELAPLGIRADALSPDITVTPLVATTMEAIRDSSPNGPPTSRWVGRASRRTWATPPCFCPTASKFITGTNMIVDGGEHLR